MKKQFTAQQKIKTVQEYFDGKYSMNQLASTLNVSKQSIRRWVINYQSMGEAAFDNEKRIFYSSETKEKAVHDYLEKQGSLLSICKKYKIKSENLLSHWILQYNRHEKQKEANQKETLIMNPGRSTTLEERLEIVQYCIEHGKNYAETAEKYQISYQQARNYTLKYEAKGINGLQDRRGKRKPESEMTDLEKLKAENRILKAQKKRAEMEVYFLKKLEEIERGWN